MDAISEYVVVALHTRATKDGKMAEEVAGPMLTTSVLRNRPAMSGQIQFKRL